MPAAGFLDQSWISSIAIKLWLARYSFFTFYQIWTKITTKIMLLPVFTFTFLKGSAWGAALWKGSVLSCDIVQVFVENLNNEWTWDWFENQSQVHWVCGLFFYPEGEKPAGQGLAPCRQDVLYAVSGIAIPVLPNKTGIKEHMCEGLHVLHTCARNYVRKTP